MTGSLTLSSIYGMMKLNETLNFNRAIIFSSQ
jgi:hypothetical protein